jgi:hypothetical protein
MNAFSKMRIFKTQMDDQVLIDDQNLQTPKGSAKTRTNEAESEFLGNEAALIT